MVEFGHRLTRELKNLVPLFRYLILQTETHAFCLGLAGAALLGFFPSCLVMLAIFKNILHWDSAYRVLLDTLRAYFPVSQDFVVYNLGIYLGWMGRRTQISSLGSARRCRRFYSVGDRIEPAVEGRSGPAVLVESAGRLFADDRLHVPRTCVPLDFHFAPRHRANGAALAGHCPRRNDVHHHSDNHDMLLRRRHLRAL